MSPNSHNNKEFEKTLFTHVSKKNEKWDALDNDGKKDFIIRGIGLPIRKDI